MDLNSLEFVLKTYGFGALALIFAGWIVALVTKHFMAKDNKKDDQILKMSIEFAGALDRNTQAIKELSESEIHRTAAIENIASGFDRMAAQNREEHNYILDFVRDARRVHN